jgi:hypothetical protein
MVEVWRACQCRSKALQPGRSIPTAGGEEAGIAAVVPIMPAQGDDGIIEVSKEDLEVALQNALRLAGCTYGELADQARRGPLPVPGRTPCLVRGP